MSEWNGMILTQKGLNLQAKVEAGECELELLRVELGSGTPGEDENVQEFTALKKHEIDVGISDKTPKDGGICTITGIITNQNVNIGFYAKEMGVIANDPDDGEILYMYATDNNPDFVPAKTSKYVVNASYSINVAISNAEMINATIDSAGLVTVSILNHYIENHNEDNTTHANLFKTLFNITEVNATKIKDKIKSYGKEVVQELFGIASATTDNIKSKVKEWAQEQIETWLESQGIRYNIAQNGYICLGHFFGDAIIQWGFYWYAANNGEEAIEVTLPVSFSQKSFISQLTNYDYTILGETHGLVISSDVGTNDLNKFKFYDLAPKGTNNSNGIFYFIIGK